MDLRGVGVRKGDLILSGPSPSGEWVVVLASRCETGWVLRGPGIRHGDEMLVPVSLDEDGPWMALPILSLGDLDSPDGERYPFDFCIDDEGRLLDRTGIPY